MLINRFIYLFLELSDSPSFAAYVEARHTYCNCPTANEWHGFHQVVLKAPVAHIEASVFALLPPIHLTCFFTSLCTQAARAYIPQWALKASFYFFFLPGHIMQSVCGTSTACYQTRCSICAVTHSSPLHWLAGCVVLTLGAGGVGGWGGCSYSRYFTHTHTNHIFCFFLA